MRSKASSRTKANKKSNTKTLKISHNNKKCLTLFNQRLFISALFHALSMCESANHSRKLHFLKSSLELQNTWNSLVFFVRSFACITKLCRHPSWNSCRLNISIHMNNRRMNVAAESRVFFSWVFHCNSKCVLLLMPCYCLDINVSRSVVKWYFKLFVFSLQFPGFLLLSHHSATNILINV